MRLARTRCCTCSTAPSPNQGRSSSALIARRAADRALRRLGTDAPQIAVGGLNPHAGEGGLFGREEIEIIGPAIETARAQGIRARGPFGADTMFHMPGVDAFVVMLHDQGHIA